MGPGLTSVNVSVLDYPYKLGVAKKIKEFLAQMPGDWDPHKRLEYLKIVIRSVLASLMGRSNRTERGNSRVGRKSERHAQFEGKGMCTG